jgi:transposase, IS30 family
MTNHYQQLSSAERATIMTRLAEGAKEAAIARELGRSRSTISRELQRNDARLDRDTGKRQPYDAIGAQERADLLAQALGTRKLAAGTVLMEMIRKQIRAGWSPEQVAGQLKEAHPDDPSKRVCHETIYTAIYVMPKGDLKIELVACLRQRYGKRRPRSRGDNRGKIQDMTSIHVRPPEVEDRVVPGHWEGDLIKGAGNKSSVGTLVERTSRLVKLVRMDNATADGTLAAFTKAISSVHGSMRKTLTYDQGKEMARHKELTAATGVKVYFCDPHSPWQRGSNENTNGLIRQYLPKGMDLSKVTQDELDVIAHMLNTRPRKMHRFKTPLDVYAGLQTTRMCRDLMI